MRSANIPISDIPNAIEKLERRISELKQVARCGLSKHDDFVNAARSLTAKIDATLETVFTRQSIEFSRSLIDQSDFIPLKGMGRASDTETALAFVAGTIKVTLKLRTEIEILREKMKDGEDDAHQRILRAYEGLILQPSIAEAASDRYRAGHYSDAIEAAVKALNNLVRLKSGLDEDGSTLMQKGFGGAAPLLRFNDLADKNDEDEQKGFMMMFSGAVAGLRNPRAHKLMKDDPERALEFIAFVSLLAKPLDGAKKGPPKP